MRPMIVFGRIMLVFLFSTLLIFHQDQQSKMLAQDETLTLVPSETPSPSALPTETAAETPTAFPTETPFPTFTTTPVPGETPTASETPTDPSEMTLTASPTDELTVIPTLPEVTFTVSPSEASSETPTETASLTPRATATASLTDAFTETATASATQSALEAEPPLSLLFTDTFDTGSLALWNLGSGWSLTNHDEGQALQAVNTDEAATFVYNTLNNAVVQTQFVMNTGMIRLSLRQSDAGAYTVILAMNGQLALYRGNQVIGTAVAASPFVNTWHTLRLSAINTLLRVSLDGQEVITTSDSTPLPAGTFSIAGINNSQSLLVDDVSLWIPTSDLLPTVTPTDTDVPTLMAAPAPFSLSMQSLAAIPSNTQIVFTAQREGNDNEIYSLDPTNCVATIDCPATQITFNVVNESYPALSTDGSKIAFVSNRSGNDELYVMNTNSNNMVRLTYNSDQFNNTLAWSPDGTKIAFVSNRSGVAWRIYVLTLANCVAGLDCPATLLSSTTTTGDFSPAWSPDGTKIAYRSRPVNTTNIWVMNADGTNKQQITDTTSTGITNADPAWSPDGNWIVFDSTRYGSNTGTEIAKLNYTTCTTPPSCAVTRLTTNSGDDEQPSWSPDGNLIAYSAQYGSTQRHLTIMNANGTNATQLTYSGINNLYANWGVLNSAYPPDADRLFIDNFEQNDFKNWSTNSQTDFGDLSVSASAAILGNYGLLANLDDSNSIYLLDGYTTTKRLRMHFSFDPNSISMANGDAHYIVTGSVYTYQVEFRRFNNEYQIRAAIDNDTAGGWSNTNWFSITDAAHFIDFAWTAATAPGTNDGSLSLWIDNALQQTITGIDNDTRSTSLVYMGAVSGVDTNTRGTYYFDEVEIRRITGSGGFIPTATPTSTVTPTPSSTFTPTATASPTPTITLTPTATIGECIDEAQYSSQALRPNAPLSPVCQTSEHGLTGKYFASTDFTNSLGIRSDTQINFIWPSGTSPFSDYSHPNDFSITWSGQLDITEINNYAFTTLSAGSIRMWIYINNQWELSIDNWQHPIQQMSSHIYDQLPVGKYDIYLAYRAPDTGNAYIQLHWITSTMNSTEIIPTEHLIPISFQLPPSIFTTTPTPTAAPTAVGSPYFVSCDLVEPSYAKVRNFPAGQTQPTPQIDGKDLMHLNKGTSVTVYELRPARDGIEWARISDYDTYHNNTLWMRTKNSDNVTDILISGTPSPDNPNCPPQSVDLTATPQPTPQSSFPIGAPNCEPNYSCPQANSLTDLQIVSFILACESGSGVTSTTNGYIQADALGNAHVIYNRMHSLTYAGSAREVVTQDNQWTPYKHGCNPTLGLDSPSDLDNIDPIIISYAQSLVNDTEPTAPFDQAIDYLGLYTFGVPNPNNSGTPPPVGTMLAPFCQGNLSTTMSLYITIASFGSGAQIRANASVFFSDSPGCNFG